MCIANNGSDAVQIESSQSYNAPKTSLTFKDTRPRQATMIDLHTHSRISDGSESPARVVELAKEAGLSAVALTDHDRFDGLNEARSRAAELEIEVVPGVEVSCHWSVGTMHMLVYFVDQRSTPIAGTLVEMQMAREERNRKIIALMNSAGIDITYEELAEEGGGAGLGKPHFARLLVRKGVVSSLQEAFDVYLEKGKPFYVHKITYEPEEMIDLALASGGLPVLAHPFSISSDEAMIPTYIERWAERGLAGIEAYYGRYDQARRQKLVSLARSLSVVATGGSDFHGIYKPDLQVGIGQGDLRVPDEALAALKERAKLLPARGLAGE